MSWSAIAYLKMPKRAKRPVFDALKPLSGILYSLNLSSTPNL